MDEQVGLRGRVSPIFSLISEGSSNSALLCGGGDLSGSISLQSMGGCLYSRSGSSRESFGDWVAGGSGSESGYSSVDEQVGLGGRGTLMSSLTSEGSPNSISLFGGRDLIGESSGVIELSEENTWWGVWDLSGLVGSAFN